MKPEWGTKRQCPECATRFYDLGKVPVTCPHCGTEFEPESLLKARRPRVERRPPPRKPEKPRPAYADEEAGEEETPEDADDADEDADLADDDVEEIDEDVDEEEGLVKKPTRTRPGRGKGGEDSEGLPIEEDSEDDEDEEDLEVDDTFDDDDDVDLDDDAAVEGGEEDDATPGGRRKRGK